MPSVGHVAVGLAAARLKQTPDSIRPWSWMLLLVALSLLPDVDVIAFALGIPWGRRSAIAARFIHWPSR